MNKEVAQFLFLAAGAVALFAFLSAASWAGAQASYRKQRDRYALLKALAEHPSDNAARVLEMLRADEEQGRRRREVEERRGHVMGGLVCVAVGIGLMIMLNSVADKDGTWTVGLIPLLVGLAVLPFGLVRGKSEPASTPTRPHDRD
jgi:hypothetical protein